MNSGISGKTFTFLKKLFEDVLIKIFSYWLMRKTAIILNLLDENQIFELARKLRILEKYFLEGFPGQKPCTLKDIPSIKSWRKNDVSKSFWSKTTDFCKYFWGSETTDFCKYFWEFYGRKSWAILGFSGKNQIFYVPPLIKRCLGNLLHGSSDQGFNGKIVKIVVEYFQGLLLQETVGLSKKRV